MSSSSSSTYAHEHCSHSALSYACSTVDDIIPGGASPQPQAPHARLDANADPRGVVIASGSNDHIDSKVLFATLHTPDTAPQQAPDLPGSKLSASPLQVQDCDDADAAGQLQVQNDAAPRSTPAHPVSPPLSQSQSQSQSQSLLPALRGSRIRATNATPSEDVLRDSTADLAIATVGAVGASGYESAPSSLPDRVTANGTFQEATSSSPHDHGVVQDSGSRSAASENAGGLLHAHAPLTPHRHDLITFHSHLERRIAQMQKRQRRMRSLAGHKRRLAHGKRLSVALAGLDGRSAVEQPQWSTSGQDMLLMQVKGTAPTAGAACAVGGGAADVDDNANTGTHQCDAGPEGDHTTVTCGCAHSQPKAAAAPKATDSSTAGKSGAADLALIDFTTQTQSRMRRMCPPGLPPGLTNELMAAKQRTASFTLTATPASAACAAVSDREPGSDKCDKRERDKYGVVFPPIAPRGVSSPRSTRRRSQLPADRCNSSSVSGAGLSLPPVLTGTGLGRGTAVATGVCTSSGDGVCTSSGDGVCTSSGDGDVQPSLASLLQVMSPSHQRACAAVVGSISTNAAATTAATALAPALCSLPSPTSLVPAIPYLSVACLSTSPLHARGHASVVLSDADSESGNESESHFSLHVAAEAAVAGRAAAANWRTAVSMSGTAAEPYGAAPLMSPFHAGLRRAASPDSEHHQAMRRFLPSDSSSSPAYAWPFTAQTSIPALRSPKNASDLSDVVHFLRVPAGPDALSAVSQDTKGTNAAAAEQPVLLQSARDSAAAAGTVTGGGSDAGEPVVATTASGDDMADAVGSSSSVDRSALPKEASSSSMPIPIALTSSVESLWGLHSIQFDLNNLPAEWVRSPRSRAQLLAAERSLRMAMHASGHAEAHASAPAVAAVAAVAADSFTHSAADHAERTSRCAGPVRETSPPCGRRSSGGARTARCRHPSPVPTNLDDDPLPLASLGLSSEDSVWSGDELSLSNSAELVAATGELWDDLLHLLQQCSGLSPLDGSDSPPDDDGEVQDSAGVGVSWDECVQSLKSYAYPRSEELLFSAALRTTTAAEDVAPSTKSARGTAGCRNNPLEPSPPQARQLVLLDINSPYAVQTKQMSDDM